MYIINKKLIKKIYIIVSNFIKKLSEDHISEYSAQCAYYTILSFIPFIILLLTLIQYTGIEQQTLYNVISNIVPVNMKGLVIDVVQEVYSKSFGTISISIIFTLWSAGKGLYGFTKGLQNIYNVDEIEKKGYIYLRIKSIIQTIFFILLIIIALTTLVFGERLISFLKRNFGVFYEFKISDKILFDIGFLLITFFIILILYKYMVKSSQKTKKQVLGAIFAVISLRIISFAFSIYLDIFKGFSITYGSLTTLILIMMWTYACFYSIFLGAEINKCQWGRLF